MANMNDPGSSRSKLAKHKYTYTTRIMYLKSSGKVEMTFDLSEVDTAKIVYVLIRSDSEDLFWDGMIHPTDFGDGVSLHFNPMCTQDVGCPCGNDRPS